MVIANIIISSDQIVEISYGGSDENMWELRNIVHHPTQMEEILNAKLLKDSIKLEPGFGTRYSALHFVFNLTLFACPLLIPCIICF